MKYKIGWLILLIVSILLLLGAGVVMGFYRRIVARGFYPEGLFVVVLTLSIGGIIAAIINLSDLF